MSEQREELATIKGIHFGLRDVGRPVIWFGVETLSGGSLQIIEQEGFSDFLKQFGCYDISELDGRAVIVSVGNCMIKFLRAK